MLCSYNQLYMDKKVVEVKGHCPTASKIIEILIPSLDSRSSIVFFVFFFLIVISEPDTSYCFVLLFSNG